MTVTYDSIATATLGSAGTFTFSSIPSTFTDLRVVVIGSVTTGSDRLIVYFNNDTASNYSSTNLRGDGTAAASGSLANVAGISVSTQNMYTTTPGMTTIDIFSYANTSINKTALVTSSNDANGSGFVHNTVGMRRNTEAINRVDVRLALGGSFSIGSTATIYGIKAE